VSNSKEPVGTNRFSIKAVEGERTITPQYVCNKQIRGQPVLRSDYCCDPKNCTNPACGNLDGALYFRGSWDPLSPFYADNILYKGHNFRTSEHAYQHEKAVYHKNWNAAREISHAPTPGSAKSIAKRWFGKCSPQWNNIKFKVMEDVMIEKARQCKEFSNKLIQSGNKLLIHNMESDPIWGYGDDGCGRDEMGKITMRVRDHLLNESCHSAMSQNSWAKVIQRNMKTSTSSGAAILGGAKPKSNSEAKPADKPRNGSSTKDGRSSLNKGSTKPRDNRPTIMMIGNSNIRGMSAEMNNMGTETTGYVFSGMRSDQLCDKLKYCKGTKYTSHVFLHNGDIDARNNPQNAVKSVIRTIDKAMALFDDSRILINTMSVNVSDQTLKDNLNAINVAITDKCRSHPELTMIDSSTMKLKDNIHFTTGSIKAITQKVLDNINYICV